MININKEVRKILKELDELAYNRRYMVDKLDAIAWPYIEHVCKVILWGDQNADWLDDWSDEVYNFIRQASSFKPKNAKVLKIQDLESLFLLKHAEDEDELFLRLAQTQNDMIQRKKYPKASCYDRNGIYKVYLEFVKVVESCIDSGIVDYVGVKDAAFNIVQEFLMLAFCRYRGEFQ